MFLLRDPPDHTRLRRSVARLFTPAAVAEFRPLVASAVEELLGKRREVDVVADVAQPLPLRVIAELLAVPVSDRPQLARWSRVLVDALDPPLPARARALPRALFQRRRELPTTFRAVRGIVSYARRALSQETQSEFVRAVATAQGEGTMSEDDAVATWVMLLIAGHETSTHLIGNGLLCLLRHHDQLARLQGDPSLMGSAVEECLRYEGPIVRVGRVAHDDVKVGETLVRQGDFVQGFLGAANRDVKVFPDPDSFDIGRSLSPPHLAFGSGIHFCLGAALARLETEVALSALVSRGPRLTQLPEQLQWRPGLALRGLVRLPVQLHREGGSTREPLPGAAV
jgi:hypothetical protein